MFLSLFYLFLFSFRHFLFNVHGGTRGCFCWWRVPPPTLHRLSQRQHGRVSASQGLYTPVQSQKAASAYLQSKQILHCGFAEQYTDCNVSMLCVWRAVYLFEPRLVAFEPYLGAFDSEAMLVVNHLYHYEIHPGHCFPLSNHCGNFGIAFERDACS